MNREEYEKALFIVEEYEKEFNRSFIKNMICICCRTKTIKPASNMSLDAGCISPLEMHTGAWSDGTVELLTFGYGSRNDMSSFYAAICDDCIEDLEKNNLVINRSILIKKLRQ